MKIRIIFVLLKLNVPRVLSNYQGQSHSASKRSEIYFNLS
jgi:hypothetical protein